MAFADMGTALAAGVQGYNNQNDAIDRRRQASMTIKKQQQAMDRNNVIASQQDTVFEQQQMAIKRQEEAIKDMQRSGYKSQIYDAFNNYASSESPDVASFNKALNSSPAMSQQLFQTSKFEPLVYDETGRNKETIWAKQQLASTGLDLDSKEGKAILKDFMSNPVFVKKDDGEITNLVETGILSGSFEYMSKDGRDRFNQWMAGVRSSITPTKEELKAEGGGSAGNVITSLGNLNKVSKAIDDMTEQGMKVPPSLYDMQDALKLEVSSYGGQVATGSTVKDIIKTQNRPQEWSREDFGNYNVASAEQKKFVTTADKNNLQVHNWVDAFGKIHKEVSDKKLDMTVKDKADKLISDYIPTEQMTQSDVDKHLSLSKIEGILGSQVINFIKEISGTAASDSERANLMNIVMGGEWTTTRELMAKLYPFIQGQIDSNINQYKLAGQITPDYANKKIQELESIKLAAIPTFLTEGGLPEGANPRTTWDKVKSVISPNTEGVVTTENSMDVKDDAKKQTMIDMIDNMKWN